jgi:hypothetical protein
MIDYRNLSEVQKWIAADQELRESDDSEKKQIGEYHRFEEGRTLFLEVEVTDTDLFKIVVSSMWGNVPLSIPGAKLKTLHLESPRKHHITEWLEEKLGELENEP